MEAETSKKVVAKSQHEATGASFRVVAGKPKGLRNRRWGPREGCKADSQSLETQ